ncbi:hypothetical protein MRX96_021264 [Rhipicephalus microplus]
MAASRSPMESDSLLKLAAGGDDGANSIGFGGEAKDGVFGWSSLKEVIARGGLDKLVSVGRRWVEFDRPSEGKLTPKVVRCPFDNPIAPGGVDNLPVGGDWVNSMGFGGEAKPKVIGCAFQDPIAPGGLDN